MPNVERELTAPERRILYFVRALLEMQSSYIYLWKSSKGQKIKELLREYKETSDKDQSKHPSEHALNLAGDICRRFHSTYGEHAKLVDEIARHLNPTKQPAPEGI